MRVRVCKAITETLVCVIVLGFLASCGGSDAGAHECHRPCVNGSPPLQCRFQFKLEYYLTLSKACKACPFNATDCFLPHCVPANGVERGVAVINRQLPGPSIQVCEGDEVVVDVMNHLGGESSSLHWHGLHMVETPYMDGVPHVTQCPIPPHTTFRYRFWARNPGTHFYHSHSGFQRADGVFGALVIRQTPERDPHAELYEFDLPEHIIMIQDWVSELGLAKFVAHHHDDGDNKPSSMLINGLGRFHLPEKYEAPAELMPLARFVVAQGKSYRFRVIGTGVLNCPVQMSIDNHTLLVIASDGSPIEPVEVDSMVISAGERYDFVLQASAEPDVYWIRFHGLLDCTFTKTFQAAILQYEGVPNASEEPKGALTYENTIRNRRILNPMNVAPGSEEEIVVTELDSLDESDGSWAKEPDHQFYLAYDFNAVNNKHFHDPTHYPIFAVEKQHRLFTPQINDISMMMPPFPPLSQRELITPGLFCNESTVSNCTHEYCHCPYVLNVKLNSLVELVIIDKGVTFDATHPFHLHGTAFRVVAMERLGSTTTVEEVKALDRNGLIKRKLVGAPIKDTVSVPDGGYVIVRFLATNPGYWLFHCHLSFHIEVGMGLVFKVGEHSDMLPVPKDFPTCGDFLPNLNEDLYAYQNKEDGGIYDNNISIHRIRHGHGHSDNRIREKKTHSSNVPVVGTPLSETSNYQSDNSSELKLKDMPNSKSSLPSMCVSLWLLTSSVPFLLSR